MNPLLAALVQAGVLAPDEAARLNRMLDDDAARAWAEQQIAAAFANGLQAQQARAVAALNGTGPDALIQPAFWDAEDALLFRDVHPALSTVAGDRAIVAAVRSGGLAHWQAVNEAVIGWVERYYMSTAVDAFGSIPNLNATARTQVGTLINQWQRGELVPEGTRARGLPDLIVSMQEVFGPERGARIGVTEVTRVFSESTRAAAQANPNTVSLRWQTARDEVVCSICGPLDGALVAKGQAFPGDYFPPAHPNCRCGVSEETELTAQVPAGIGGAGTWNFASRRT